MKIKIIKSIRLGNHSVMRPGEVFEARRLPTGSLLTLPGTPYQIIEGAFSGVEVPIENCILISDEKIFTQKEVQALENVHLAKLEKLSAEKNRAIDLVTNMSKQLVKKNAEIEKLEFCVSALSIGLSASSEAIAILRETAKQNG
jgi:hypothetical protein